MAKPFAAYSTSDLMHAIETSFWRSWTPFGDLPMAQIAEDDSGLRWFITGLPDPLLNAVLHTRIAPGVAEARVRAMIAHVHAKQVPMSWYIGPSDLPANLGVVVTTCGLVYADTAVGMAIDLRQLPRHVVVTPNFSIRQTDSAETLAEWLAVFQAGFAVSDAFMQAYTYLYTSAAAPDLTDIHYLGLLDGRAVACVTLTLDHGIANIYDLATLPSARRQGIGAALTLAALLEARTRGCELGVLQASRAGVAMYRRMGFVAHCTFERYTSAPGQPGAGGIAP